MGVTTAKAFPLQQDRTILTMYYDQFTHDIPQWKQLFAKTKAPKGADYTRADISGLGASMREAEPGEPVEYVSPVEGNKVRRTFKKYQLGFQITEEDLEDELFDKMKQMAAGLAVAGIFTIEAKTWSLFNYAFDSSYSLAKDGLPILSPNHKTLNGKAINNVITGDLAQTTLQAAMEYFSTALYSEDDIPITEFLDMLIIHPNDMWMAADLLKSTGRVFDGSMADANKGLVDVGGTKYAPSAEGRLNLLNPSAGVVSSWKYMPVRFLTDPDAWFATSKNFDGQVMFKRDLTLQSADDPTTGNRLYRNSTRFLPFIDEYRYICGSQGV